MIQILTITAFDDLIPEVSEHFTITLISATSADNTQGSTPISGASLKPRVSATTSNVTLEEGDYPYGLFEFSTADSHMTPTSPPTTGGESWILPATEQPLVCTFTTGP